MRHAAPRLALAALVLVLSAVMSTAFFVKRPAVVSFDVASHPLAPAIKRVVVNGLELAEADLNNRGTSGEIPYRRMFSRDLDIDVLWYDILADRAYGVAFTVDAGDLSTFDAQGSHAAIEVLMGPGADLRAITPHPQLLRLLHDDRQEQITPEMDIPVTLTALCATPLALDDPRITPLVAVARAAALDRAMENRENAIRHGWTAGSRCAGDADAKDWTR